LIALHGEELLRVGVVELDLLARLVALVVVVDRRHHLVVFASFCRRGAGCDFFFAMLPPGWWTFAQESGLG
jgi:hypothetical protein